MDPNLINGLNNAFGEAHLSRWVVAEHGDVDLVLERLPNWDFDGDTAWYPTVTVSLSDVSRIAASLRRGEYLDRSAPVASFGIDSLDSIMQGFWPGAIFGHFIDADPTDAAWRDRLSLDIQRSAHGGSHTFSLWNANPEWAFDLIIWFDHLAVFDTGGAELDLDRLIAGGDQFAKAVHEDHPSTAQSGIVPFPDNFWELVASGELDKIPPEQRHRIPPNFWDDIDSYRELAKEFLRNKRKHL